MRSAAADNAPMMLDAADPPVSGVFGRMFNLLIAIAENNGQYQKLSALSALSDEDLAALFPDVVEADALTALKSRASARILILTRGAAGVTAFLGDERIDLPAAPVTHLVDTVGAGDTFTATVLAGLADAGALTIKGMSMLDCPRFRTLLHRAAAAAAINCAFEGCNPPTRADIDAALGGAA